MSNIDFILPKVDGKLDVKTPSRWYISGSMLAEEFAHFADKNSHISHDRGALIGLIYRQLMTIHEMKMPTIDGHITISGESDVPYWVREIYMVYNERSDHYVHNRT